MSGNESISQSTPDFTREQKETLRMFLALNLLVVLILGGGLAVCGYIKNGTGFSGLLQIETNTSHDESGLVELSLEEKIEELSRLIKGSEDVFILEKRSNCERLDTNRFTDIKDFELKPGRNKVERCNHVKF